MKQTLALTAFGLLLAGLPAIAQDQKPPNKWDITKVDTSKLPPAATTAGLTFEKDIQPMLKTSCVNCHGEDRPKHDFRVDSLDAVLKGGREGKMVVPGDSKNSLLVAACAQINDPIAMPPKGRGPRGGRPGGPPPGGPAPDQAGGAGGPPPGGPGPGGPPPEGGPGLGGPPPDGGPGPGGPGGPGRRGPAPKPLTADQVGILRAWIDQGAK